MARTYAISRLVRAHARIARWARYWGRARTWRCDAWLFLLLFPAAFGVDETRKQSACRAYGAGDPPGLGPRELWPCGVKKLQVPRSDFLDGTPYQGCGQAAARWVPP